MILYSASKSEFSSDILSNQIETKLIAAFQKRLAQRVGESEVTSWRNSLMYMHNAVSDADIPADASVALEYRIPQNNRRIDFIISGKNSEKRSSLVIVELKQWTEAKVTTKDAVVETVIGRGSRETPHPSYQAWTYASLLKDYNTVIQNENISVEACAYLHNSRAASVFLNPFYAAHIERAPLFLRDDAAKLTAFIKKHVRYGDKKGILYRIDQGKVRPSKSLADSLASILQGNEEFLMIDDQKIVFETALSLAEESNHKKKRVLIVEGGPGSGKSVVAVNLLVAFTKNQMTSKYVTKNAAPRAVYEQLLTGTYKKSAISNLFVGSGSFTEMDKNSFDTLVVDEAHRLNEKSGLYSNLGINQVHEIIKSSLFSVFFIDESQKVTLKDIGTKEEICRWAKKEGAEVSQLELASQFRCNGSDAYISWLDHTLQIHETANSILGASEYHFKVVDDPNELRRKIEEMNAAERRNKSRVVAGYCWDWKSKNDKNADDITIGPDFKMKWNLASDGSTWIIEPKSVAQAGCIHTCQGLELDYVGVIVGPDFMVRDGVVITDGLKRARADQSLKGFKSKLKTDPKTALREADLIIKNTYRTLMTRGMKGCFLYSVDPETREYFKAHLGS